MNIQGSLIYPGDKDYDANRVTWNKDVSGKPSVIARVTCEEDVVNIIKYAATNKTLLGVASGRHSALCMIDDAVVIDFSLMKKIEFNHDYSQVTVQSGVKMTDVDSACKPFGVAIVGGTNP